MFWLTTEGQYFVGALRLLVSLRWSEGLARRTSVFLFLFRLAGVALLELTGIRMMLFVFPNHPFVLALLATGGSSYSG